MQENEHYTSFFVALNEYVNGVLTHSSQTLSPNKITDPFWCFRLIQISDHCLKRRYLKINENVVKVVFNFNQ